MTSDPLEKIKEWKREAWKIIRNRSSDPVLFPHADKIIDLCDAYEVLLAQQAKQAEIIAEAKKALEFYADPIAWYSSEEGWDESDFPMGHTAKEALQKISELESGDSSKGGRGGECSNAVWDEKLQMFVVTEILEGEK